MRVDYEENGYCVIKQLYKEAELVELRNCLLQFHQLWKKDNLQFYSEQAINSAYITATKYLASECRLTIFKFIAATKLMNIVYALMPVEPVFMNTQLFFNPVNKTQKNYWHRDPQYHLSVEEQKQALSGPEVIHFRLPLYDEPGLECVPGTHKRWDSAEELAIRLQKNGRKNSDDLSTGVTIPLETGDLLVFSANMIHRGLYGMNRFALDILFCDPDPGLAQYIDADCLPDQQMLMAIEDARVFKNAIRLKQQ